MAEKWVKGFTVSLRTDHKNNVEFERVLKTRRGSKKLVNWCVDMLPTIGRVRRLYIAGEKNVLADVLSRYGWDQHVANHLPVPDLPIRKKKNRFCSQRPRI